MSWIIANYGSVLVTAILIAAVVLAVRSIINDRKNGVGSCGQRCSSCGLHASGTCEAEKLAELRKKKTT